ncbi:MAG: hypothetical protein ACI9GW_002101 [Halieaceae bacterium]|jgi:hypothetical protein
MEPKRVVVWGTGNVGRPAIRAILSHRDLELVGVIVANPDKVGIDAGDIAGVASCGIIASDQSDDVLSLNPDVVVYTATADIRPEQAMNDLLRCLRSGINVVSSAFYSFLDPISTSREITDVITSACRDTGASLFVSGIDPGWAMDMLPIAVSGACADISEIRSREIFNYALYDQPQVVREVIGFGGSMEDTPLMLHDFAIEMVWGPMLHIVGRAMGKAVETVEVVVERLPLDATIDIPGMGVFEKGTQGAFRFEIKGMVGGRALYVVEHITRIDDRCAPDWPYPPVGSGCHQLIISGSPTLELSVHGHDPVENGPAGGGNSSAAAWIVNAIPGVCDGMAGIVTLLDLPAITGAAQMRSE